METNLYLNKRLTDGLSLRGANAGTFGTICAQLTHIIRFCYRNSVNFNSFSDARYAQFIDGLEAERVFSARMGEMKRRRDANHVRGIGSITLDFLNFVGELYGIYKYVAKDGIIEGERVQGQVRVGDSSFEFKGWTHWRLPDAVESPRRHYVRQANVDLLKGAALKYQKSRYLRARLWTEILLLEVTGGRRMEIENLRVEDILIAATNQNKAPSSSREGLRQPCLRLQSVKSDPNATRDVPITTLDLHHLMEYVTIARRPFARRKKREMAMAGPLLLSATTCDGITEEAITLDLFKLCRAAGIPSEVSPQLFRHRYITKRFINLIYEYDLHNLNPKSFMAWLITRETLVAQVKEWSGHKLTSSLLHYVHWAYDEIRAAGARVDVEMMARYQDALRAAQVRYEQRIAMGVDAGIAGNELAEALMLANEAFDGIHPAK